MSRTLVFGRSGQLASEIRALRGADPNFVFIGKEEVDTSDISSLRALLSRLKPKVVINCFAYTAVDRAEEEAAFCFKINKEFPAKLADLGRELDFHLVHFSTDYVFDGAASNPYVEDSPCNPLNVYGRSKFEGELEVCQRAHSAAIVRTSWLYSKHGNNFVKTMLRLADGEKPLRVVADQKGSPTWARELASAVVNQFSRPNGRVEIFHFSGNGETTWASFAEKIMEVWGKTIRIEPISTADYKTPAKRPVYSVLSKSKFESTFKESVPNWIESLTKAHATWENP